MRDFYYNYIRSVEGHGAGTTLEIGPGEGDQVVALAWRGFNVVAVESGEMDLAVNEEVAGRSNIEWVRSKCERWVDTEAARRGQFVGILASNVIHFMDPKFVRRRFLPYCASHLVTGGILAIRAFTEPAEVPFGRQSSAKLSYWPESEFSSLLSPSQWSVETEVAAEARVKSLGPLLYEYEVAYTYVLATKL